MISEDDAAILDRLKQAAQLAGGPDALARKTGIPRRTLGNYLSGKNPPKLPALVAIARTVGVSLEWLATGHELPIAGPVLALQPTAVAVDRELFGRVVDAIQRLYKEQHVGLAGVDLGRLAAERYEEIAAATGDPDERLAMVKLMVVQLRKDLAEAATTPGYGKRSAS